MAHLHPPSGPPAHGFSDDYHLRSWPPKRRSKVTFDLEPVGEMVKLTVVHDDFDPGSLVIEGVREGWPRILSQLKTLLESGEAPPAWPGGVRAQGNG